MKAFLVWLGFALSSVPVAAQQFNPVNDTSAIIIEIRNFDADSVEVQIGTDKGTDFKSFGFIRSKYQRTLNIVSSSLGDAQGVVVVFLQEGAIITARKPVILRRGGYWLLVIGTPPRKENA